MSVNSTSSSIASISFRLAANDDGSGTFSSTSLYNRSATASRVMISARVYIVSRRAKSTN